MSFHRNWFCRFLLATPGAVDFCTVVRDTQMQMLTFESARSIANSDVPRSDGGSTFQTATMRAVNSLWQYHMTHSRFLSGLYAVDRRGFASSPSLKSDPDTYCRELVRKRDYESFLNSYFYPSYARRGYFAIKAFSVGNLIHFGFEINSALVIG